MESKDSYCLMTQSFYDVLGKAMSESVSYTHLDVYKRQAQDPPGSPASLTRSARQSTCASARSTSARSGTVPSWKFHSRTAEPTVTSNSPSLSAQYPMAARSSSAV